MEASALVRDDATAMEGVFAIERPSRAALPDLEVLDVAARLSALFVAFRREQVAHAERSGLPEAAGAVVEIDGAGVTVWHGMLHAVVEREHRGPYGGRHYLAIRPVDDGCGPHPRLAALDHRVEDAPGELAAIAARIDALLADARQVMPRIAVWKQPSVRWLVDSSPLRCGVGTAGAAFQRRPYLLLRNESRLGTATPRYPASL